MSIKTERFFYGFLGLSIFLVYAAPFFGLPASMFWQKILPFSQKVEVLQPIYEENAEENLTFSKELQPNFHVSTTNELAHIFNAHGFSVEEARVEKNIVPKLYLASLPRDLKRVSSIQTRKEIFLKTLLPIIIEVNQNILDLRQQILSLQNEMKSGHVLTTEEKAWLTLLCEEYRVKNLDITALLERVDVIPISLALAQGSLESGWGTSKLAQKSNSLFGHTSKVQKYAKFDNLVHTVEAYVKNLNTHRAYESFRKERALCRLNEKPLDAHRLAGGLKAYSELGMAYVHKLRRIMKAYSLYDFDVHLEKIEQQEV